MPRNEIVIRIAIPEWTRRRWFAVITGILLLGGAVAWADLYARQTYMTGEKLSSAKINQEFLNIENAIKQLDARTSGNPDCLPGYLAAVGNGITTCTKGNDVMVKVGTGPSAFWIDKYEASVWSKPDGMGTQYGVAGDDYPVSFPKNGQRAMANVNFMDHYAVSRMGVPPSASLTWFQAQQACTTSGKRLPNDEEWQRAASGTLDPVMGIDGAIMGETRCNTQSSKNTARQTALGTNCVSAWGAQDMVGNVWEWTANWFAGTGDTLGKQFVNRGVQNWPAAFNGDGTWNVAAHTALKEGSNEGIPAAAIRGGSWSDGPQAGVFALDLTTAPSHSPTNIGFRCVAP